MGFLNAVKGFLNIGGVSVKMQGVSQRVSRSGNLITGNVLLTSKGDKLVLKLTYRLAMKVTRGKANEREIREYTLAETIDESQFEMKEGESKTIPFTIPYRIEPRAQDQGGFLGAMGKISAFATDEREDYYITALCDVKGTALDPSDRIDVVLVD